GMTWTPPPGELYLRSAIPLGVNAWVTAEFDAPPVGHKVGVSFDTGDGADAATAIAASPTHPLIAVGYRSGRVELRDTSTGGALSARAATAGEVSSLSFDRKGARLLGTFRSGIAALWEIDKDQFSNEILNRKLLDDAILMGTLAPGGTRFSVCRSQGGTVVYDLAAIDNPRPVTSPQVPHTVSSAL